MKVLNELVRNNWDFILYKTDEGFIINVVFYSSAVNFSRSFRVSEEETNQDFEGLKQLSEQIRSNYEVFKDREIVPAIKM
ncbi:hypothetical protein OKW21_005733 [Catalinimonas alkaloidigena]|uniref:hypothetical protein n=1 Tax=Catalinimonas alkaloidigena TaxID=1075417 RepID=UPI00240548C6|nr:hypothetical protein [Catalinimonas alkaloidigena]MDF9800470.1 hypothetical protein [Catalinimonas alkaloidigena]